MKKKCIFGITLLIAINSFGLNKTNLDILIKGMQEKKIYLIGSFMDRKSYHYINPKIESSVESPCYYSILKGGLLDILDPNTKSEIDIEQFWNLVYYEKADKNSLGVSYVNEPSGLEYFSRIFNSAANGIYNANDIYMGGMILRQGCTKSNDPNVLNHKNLDLEDKECYYIDFYPCLRYKQGDSGKFYESCYKTYPLLSLKLDERLLSHVLNYYAKPDRFHNNIPIPDANLWVYDAKGENAHQITDNDRFTRDYNKRIYERYLLPRGFDRVCFRISTPD